MRIKMNQKGFTLIELLIVVAIIAILAAIAIPQFAAYRMRGYNGAAQSDIRNLKTLEESVMAEYGGYGTSQFGAGLTLLALAAPPIPTPPFVTGPQIPGQQAPPPPGTSAMAIGTWIDANNDNAREAAIGLGGALSNTVKFIAEVSDNSPLMSAVQDYRLVSMHERGNRAFSTSANPTVCVAEDENWALVDVARIEATASPPAAPYSQTCAGNPSGSIIPAYITWVAL